MAPGLIVAGHGAGVSGSRYVFIRPPATNHGGQPVLAYQVTKAIPLIPTPLIKDNRLFFWTDQGIVSCLRLETGEVLWSERVPGSYYSSPIWVNGRLYGVSKNGDIVVVAAADRFELVARMSLGESSYATPAVAGGVIYLRTWSHLFSIGGPGKKNG